ncbi:MAG: hypothetical protein LBF90_02325 [Prevotellaceae bacterium]|jgi:hypothetical protein|nr:hypothetical protein [Prevotellaceae bacterium]
MKIYLKFFLLAIVTSALLSACGSTKMAKTPEQKVATNRGVKLEKEECEELALKESENWRASGVGMSAKEIAAVQLAEHSAKGELARQLEESIFRLFGGIESLGNKNPIRLSNLRIICRNTYLQKDGAYIVYVCIEMSENGLSNIYKELIGDVPIDYSYKQFKTEMEKAREEYRNGQ